jgi:DNA primase
LIKPDTIQSIIDTARIEEVVGDFVPLKKRGVNRIGSCPFHNEKTPSFTVSPAKGIYKCFGCGKAGNSVNFIMEHELLSYPDALRYLAKKYFIEIDEELPSAEQQLAISEKETLYNVSSFAQKFFTNILTETDEGKAIGLSYFKERGFSEQTIEKFMLGYCPEKWDAFTKAAQDNGYKTETLISSGLTIASENKLYDRFRGRVMFPIQNISGRVLGFGGRVLSSDKTKAKYVNSPETDIYHKSQVLYGLFQAKNSISGNDNCFLVEGYTDVLSMHQAGIENVVSSSGTSLTTEQIRLIRRFTPNITILYDGDAAGIKASFRGIDMILEEGMNVKIVLFPDGEDPDSFARKLRPAEVKDFISSAASDFIGFKTRLLSEETKGDPVKRAGLIKEIVHTISLIPDPIIRSVYVKECSETMQVAEAILANEINKQRQAKHKEKKQDTEPETSSEESTFTSETQILPDLNPTEYQEKELLRFLLNFGDKEIDNETIDEDGDKIIAKIKLAEFILTDLQKDKIIFNNPAYQVIYDLYITESEKGQYPDLKFFINYPDQVISRSCIDIIHFPYELSENWEKLHRVLVSNESDNLEKTAIQYICSLKLKRIETMIQEASKKIKDEKDEEAINKLLTRISSLTKIRRQFTDQLTQVVTK